MDSQEAARIGAAINALRPDWPARSIAKVITTRMDKRAPVDVALALTWVAFEADSNTPARAAENGPWWSLTTPGSTAPTVTATPCPAHPAHPAHACRQCRREATPMPAHVRADLADIFATRRRGTDRRPYTPEPTT